MPVSLPELPYAYDVLEPHIDAKTMEIHCSRHHQTYVNNLNAALENTEYAQHSLESLVAEVETLPEKLRAPMRTNGGGHANHSLFRTLMSPQRGGQPQGELAQAIPADVAGFASLRDAFTKAALTRFGSGWAWLDVDAQGKLTVESSANQDNPAMRGIASGNTAILGLDAWEHACYLKYQNRRPEYIAAFYNVINWNQVARRYAVTRTKGNRL